MVNPQRRANDNKTGHFPRCFEMIGQGRFTSPNKRLVILCLGLLNTVLLVVAVVIGMKCAKVKEASLQASHSAAAQLDELNDLRSNNSDAIKAREEAKSAFDRALRNRIELKVKIEQQKATNDNYQRQTELLRRERAELQSNVSALEGSCGRCLTKWIHYNTSCYFFSYTESRTQKLNWPNSRENCVRRGADLIVIDNKEEQQFVSHKIENMIGPGNQDRRFWIGLTDTGSEGTWVWINHVTEMEPRYWMVGEPNNAGIMEEDCAATVPSTDSPWRTRFDDACGTTYKYFICEMISS